MADDHSPETRQDRITRQWVACAPTRSTRPHKTGSPQPDRDPTDDTPVEGCPFCPGHEEQLPSVIWQLEADDARPWQTRVVPNKYPALTPDDDREVQTCGLYQTRTSYGRQEVVVDTPYHHQGLAQMPVGQVEAVLETYLSRYHTLRQTDPPLYPFVFRNHGAKAGASIAHPHSQIIASDFAPPRIEREEAQARSRYEDAGECPYCEMIDDELAAEARLVWTNEHFVVFVPFAARVPYEMWILPREHEPEFGRLTDAERAALAPALHQAVSRLYDRLDDPDYNFFVRTALDYESNAPHLHWSLRLRPRTTVEAGFELSTGVQVNPSIPERDAAVLRGDA
jgi:UDPglucose--hexose-1-phosphate uridylyltransferase